MATPTPITGVNDTPEKIEDVTCDCDLLWSLAQSFSITRLSDKVGENEYELTANYVTRAKRIAATYARIYLETEEGGDSSKRGRYYWMALGAFASKTVACLLDGWQVKSSYAATLESMANGLAQGNLWLFLDISASHWFYSHYPEHFEEGMNCVNKRDAANLERPVKEVVYELPWAHRSIDKVKGFESSSHLKEGFGAVKKIEEEGDLDKRRRLQMDNLNAIAHHEQGIILQPLIYENRYFKRWAEAQRMASQGADSGIDAVPFVRDWQWVQSVKDFLLVKYELVFSHQCQIDDPELKSEAPDDMVVENFKSRMDWIEDAALLFHDLMKKREDYMLNELNTIASWVNVQDPFLDFYEPW